MPKLREYTAEQWHQCHNRLLEESQNGRLPWGTENRLVQELNVSQQFVSQLWTQIWEGCKVVPQRHYRGRKVVIPTPLLAEKITQVPKVDRQSQEQTARRLGISTTTFRKAMQHGDIRRILPLPSLCSQSRTSSRAFCTACSLSTAVLGGSTT